MSSKHANTRPSGEKEIKDTAIYTLIFMLIASKYAMNVSVSSMQTLPDIKMPLWRCCGSSCEQLHTANTKSLLSKDNATLQGLRKNWLSLASVQSAPCHAFTVPAHCIHAVFRDTDQASLLLLGTELQQLYLAPKNPIFPKLTGWVYSHFIVCLQCDNWLILNNTRI